MKAGIQTALAVMFPPRCLGCGGIVDSDFALCGPCWRDTPFITGLSCDACGVQLPGQGGGGPVHCDDCLRRPRPWSQGRSVLMYRDLARRLVMALKHGQRTEIARPAALWMARAGADLVRPDMIVAPVPLHWSRLFRRGFNQSALLADAVARHVGLAHCPDLLSRPRRTRSLDHRSVSERFDELHDAIRVHPGRHRRVAGKPVLLVDDVMTSGATLAAATDALRQAGSGDVFVLTLARVAKDA
ncbi:MAG: ComF family protein [Rhodobacteraceae bacterium]|nr:MAG: ComF family protein [Paracoccaceae bacterium]